MKLHQSELAGHHLFSGYGDGYFELGQTRYSHPLVVCGEHAAQWSATSFDALAPEHFAELARFEPEVVLVGCGKAQRLLHPRLYAALSAARVGVEVMDSAAACRTYNILHAEGRKVLAALLPA
ncbi:Mth938-like domain-containing protein [Crenobacter caeni]|uniref:Xcc1710-like domain-containing protein n=1 Tax=Crenobacter caeni TaxID=2705474 RepID=A0A6B2KW13_9NEIS|nr:Mth938-like domain-containing protein [Crenobacter caeni]NDV14210.1 Xcc1710-like domain-containing protein [Crenobacter caeni]